MQRPNQGFGRVLATEEVSTQAAGELEAVGRVVQQTAMAAASMASAATRHTSDQT